MILSCKALSIRIHFCPSLHYNVNLITEHIFWVMITPSDIRHSWCISKAEILRNVILVFQSATGHWPRTEVLWEWETSHCDLWHFVLSWEGKHRQASLLSFHSAKAKPISYLYKVREEMLTVPQLLHPVKHALRVWRTWGHFWEH